MSASNSQAIRLIALLKMMTQTPGTPAYFANALDVDEPIRRCILDAAVDSFELNRRVFADLGASREPEHAAAGGPA